MSESRTFTARWVFPVAGPPLENGIVTICGDRIEAVQPRGERTADEDLGNVAIVPGLVNPHTHLDLSGARGLIPPTDPDHFTDWLRGVIAYRRSRSADQIQDDIRAGLAECLRSGTTLIGDIAAEGASWDAVSVAQTRAVVFREIIGLGKEAAQRKRESARWARSHTKEWDPIQQRWELEVPTCKPGYSPHAPYSVHAAVLMGSVSNNRPVTIHLAESPGELELLEKRSGPFVDFLHDVGAWREGMCLAESLAWVVKWTTSHWTPKRNDDIGVLLAHCNYLSPDTTLRPHVTIVYCPRTHAAFRHPPHPFREFLQRGVRVCLGTDSLASNPDLDILAEARFVHEKYPDFPGDQLLRMITLSGAEALGWATEAGSLEPGKSADFVAIPLPNQEADPHAMLFANHAGDRRTLFCGEWRNSSPS